MNWFTSLVLLAVLWFMTLFVILPIRMKTQGEEGEVVPGTPSSAPANLSLKRKFLVTTIVAAGVWGVVLFIILSGHVTREDFDLFTRFGGHLYRY